MRRVLFASLVAAGCTTSSSSPTPPAPSNLQMNDLSVMMPLPQSDAELAAWMAPTSPGVGGAILPDSIITTVPIGIDTTSLRVAAFRLDPCFGALGSAIDDATCQNQLRIVWEPMFAEDQNGVTPDGAGSGSGSAVTPAVSVADAALHAFYSISRDQLLSLVNEIVDARVADGGDHDLGPLAPNPIIASEGLSGTLAQSYASILGRYAGGANLVRVTFFEVEAVDGIAGGSGGQNPIGGGEFWELNSFNVADGSATPRAIPTLMPQDGVPDGGSDVQNGMSLSASLDPLESSGSPGTTSNDNIALLESTIEAGSAAKSDVQAAFDSALRIENPHDNSPDTIDCASCHLAQPALQLVGAPLGMSATGDANAFVPDSRIPVADLAQTTSLDSDGILNIHAFSYRDVQPMINQRVINETAANWAYIEKLTGGSSE